MTMRQSALLGWMMLAVTLPVLGQSDEGTTSRPLPVSNVDARPEGGGPFLRELWLHALRQEPSIGESAFGVTLEAIYHFESRAHDRWRRNVASEALARPAGMLRAEVGYDPASALVTGGGGFHLFLEGLDAVATRSGLGGYARYDRASSGDDVTVTDLEVGGQFSFWSDERRVYTNEKLGYRSIETDRGTDQVDAGGFIQLRHHLVFVPSEDWTLTFVQDADLRVGIGSGPHTNSLRVENLFLLSPSLLLSVGPMVGVDLDYLVGPATTTLAVPIGLRAEIHPGSLVVALTGSYDLPTLAEQRSIGLIIRGSAGLRF